MMWRQVSPEHLGPSTQLLLLFLLSLHQEQLSERDKGLALQETPQFSLASRQQVLSLLTHYLYKGKELQRNKHLKHPLNSKAKTNGEKNLSFAELSTGIQSTQRHLERRNTSKVAVHSTYSG